MGGFWVDGRNHTSADGAAERASVEHLVDITINSPASVVTNSTVGVADFGSCSRSNKASQLATPAAVQEMSAGLCR